MWNVCVSVCVWGVASHAARMCARARACVCVWLNSSVSILPRVLHHFSTSKSHQRNLAWGKFIDPPSYCPKGEQFRNTRPSVWNYPTSTFEWNILWKKKYFNWILEVFHQSQAAIIYCVHLVPFPYPGLLSWSQLLCVMWLCAADGAQCRMLIKATVLCSKWGCCCHVFFLPFGGRA